MFDWLYDFFFGSNNRRTDYLYDTPHLTAIVSVVVLSILAVIVAKKMNKKQINTTLWIFFGVLLAFEVMHRVYRFVRGHAWYDYIPMHFSSIAVWMIIIACATKNKHLLNLSVISGILAGVSFLAYPGVGFNVDVLKFTNYYSIITHCIDIIFASFAIAAGLVSYKWRELWITALFFIIVFLHSILLNFVFFTGENYLYYVENITSLPYWLYLIGYFAILIIYTLSFYVINSIFTKYKNKARDSKITM